MLVVLISDCVKFIFRTIKPKSIHDHYCGALPTFGYIKILLAFTQLRNFIRRYMDVKLCKPEIFPIDNTLCTRFSASSFFPFAP